jgi:hypothetical protein
MFLAGSEEDGEICAVVRCFVGMVLALTVLGSATVAQAATGQPLYRTRHEAEFYLEHGLRIWDGNNLGRTDLRAAYCISGYAALPKTNEDYPQSRVNRLGVDVYRTFACTLYAEVRGPSQVKGHSQVYGLYLVATRLGWRIKALR